MDREMSRWEFFDGVTEKCHSLKEYAQSKYNSVVRWNKRDIRDVSNWNLFTEFAQEHFENYWNSLTRLAEDIASDSWHDISTMEDMWGSWDNIAATIRDQIPLVIDDAINATIIEAALRGFYQDNSYCESLDSEYIVFASLANGLTALTVYPAFQIFSNRDIKLFLQNLKEKKEEMLTFARSYVPMMLAGNRCLDL